MKKYVCLIGIICMLLLASASFGMVDLTVFEETFVRETGTPVTDNRSFPAISGKAIIKLTVEKVSSSEIMVNGQPVFVPSDFNQRVSYLEKEVTLSEGQNSISILVKSKPGGRLTVKIVQEVNAEAASIIGPEGGVIEVTDPTSPIYGAKVEVPEGELINNVFVTIESAINHEMPPPSGAYLLGGLDLKPNGLQFSKPIKVIMPLNSNYPKGTPIGILYYDGGTYLFETEGIVTESGDKIDAYISHFSKHFPIDQLKDENDQMRFKNQIIESLSILLSNKYEEQCFYKKQFIQLGDIEKVIDRLNDKDVHVVVDPDYFIGRSSDAEYVDWCVPAIFITTCSGSYFNDIVLKSEPKDVNLIDLYHEVMHAIFDNYDDELEDAGIPDDEAATWYMQNMLMDDIGWINRLVSAEKELEKAKRGEASNLNQIKIDLAFLVSQITSYIQSPTGGEGNTPPPITSTGLLTVRELTGFYVLGPEEIKQKYLSGECGTLPPATPAHLATTAVSSSEIYLTWVEPPVDQVNGIPSYKVFRNGTFIDTVFTNSYSDMGLSPSTQYCYTVSTYDEAGLESVQSAQSCTMTFAPNPDTVDNDGDGYSENQGDCDDSDRDRFPGNPEKCDNKDNDCNYQVDEGVLNACGTCGAVPVEICGDGIDQDCDGSDKTCAPVSTGWTRATASAPWSARYGHASVVHDGKMWVLGGSSTATGRKNDVWYSTDGVNWTQATAAAPWSARDGLNAVVFNGKIWVLTGYTSWQGHKTDVWYSSDGLNWTMATSSAPWPGRDWSSVVVFDGRIWILGGVGLNNRLNDVWSSADGITWTLATASAPWSRREQSSALVFDNKMWIVGGYADGGPVNDVWYSTDGFNWTQATVSAAWKERSHHTTAVSDGKMWIIGGNTTVSAGYANDIWYSINGVNWTQATASAEWKARTGHTSVVHNQKIWVLGGGDLVGYFNDVWFSQ